MSAPMTVMCSIVTWNSIVLKGSSIDQKACAIGMVSAVKTASAPAPSQVHRLAMISAEPRN